MGILSRLLGLGEGGRWRKEGRLHGVYSTPLSG